VLTNLQDPVVEIPQERVDHNLFDKSGGFGKFSSKWCSMLDDGNFNTDFFGLSSAEVRNIDPQQILLLEQAWHSLEDAGIPPSSLPTDVGVWVGMMNIDNKESQKDIDAFWSTGNTASAAAGRMCYLFGINGPAVPIDTACSSFLVSMHFAKQNIILGEVSGAFVGGVNVCLTSTPFIAETAMMMLSPDGRCKSFDEEANGFVRGEGLLHNSFAKFSCIF
jgi:acyl transferase domain-containing protein